MIKIRRSHEYCRTVVSNAPRVSALGRSENEPCTAVLTITILQTFSRKTTTGLPSAPEVDSFFPRHFCCFGEPPALLNQPHHELERRTGRTKAPPNVPTLFTIPAVERTVLGHNPRRGSKVVRPHVDPPRYFELPTLPFLIAQFSFMSKWALIY